MMTPNCGQIKNVIGMMIYITNMSQNIIKTLNVRFQKKFLKTKNIIIFKSHLAILAP